MFAFQEIKWKHIKSNPNGQKFYFAHIWLVIRSGKWNPWLLYHLLLLISLQVTWPNENKCIFTLEESILIVTFPTNSQFFISGCLSCTVLLPYQSRVINLSCMLGYQNPVPAFSLLNTRCGSKFAYKQEALSVIRVKKWTSPNGCTKCKA